MIGDRSGGFCLYYKMLERGRFPWPSPAEGAIRLTSAQMAMLFEGLQEYPLSRV